MRNDAIRTLASANISTVLTTEQMGLVKGGTSKHKHKCKPKHVAKGSGSGSGSGGGRGHYGGRGSGS
jgi:hypothetical protein